MAAECGGLYLMFLGPPLRSFWIRYWLVHVEYICCFFYREIHGSYDVEKISREMTSRYGCFTSFTGRYVASAWTLDLDDVTCA